MSRFLSFSLQRARWPPPWPWPARPPWSPQPCRRRDQHRPAVRRRLPELIDKTGISMVVPLKGDLGGLVAAFVLATLAVSMQIGRDLLTLTAMFNPLPAIALLPLALLWFGLGQASLVFVLIHSVLWPLALNTFAGFQAVPETLRMAGHNYYGLTGLRCVLQILVPAALPSILSGLKVGWAFHGAR